MTDILGPDYRPAALRRATHRIILGVLAALVLALTAAPAQASSIPLPIGYYGVNFQRMAKLGPAAQDVHLASIASLGVNQVRFNVSWAAIEPLAPRTACTAIAGG